MAVIDLSASSLNRCTKLLPGILKLHSGELKPLCSLHCATMLATSSRGESSPFLTLAGRVALGSKVYSTRNPWHDMMKREGIGEARVESFSLGTWLAPCTCPLDKAKQVASPEYSLAPELWVGALPLPGLAVLAAMLVATAPRVVDSLICSRGRMVTVWG